MTCRVGVVDDHHGIRLLFRTSMNSDPRFEWVGEASNGFEAVMLVEQHRPDVVLLDLTMPILDGLEALPLIRSACPETKILLFSSYVEPSRVSAGMPSLPDAFIDKGQALETVLEAILELSLQEAPAVLSQESPPAGR